MTISAASRAPSRLTPALKRRVVREAIDFLVEREGLSPTQRAQLEAVPVRWRRRRGRSKFYLGAAHGHAGPHVLLCVGRGAELRWHTYRRVRAGLTTPPGGVVMPMALYATVVLVHEFTHALQHGVCGTPKRRYSEVETTDAEIEFVRRVAPQLHAQLVPVQGGKARRAKARAAQTSAVRGGEGVANGLIGWLWKLIAPRA